MTKALAVLTGIGTGALLMYLFDPRGGGRRRALIRDKAVGISNDVSQALGKTGRDLRNRAEGLFHEAKSIASLPESSKSTASNVEGAS